MGLQETKVRAWHNVPLPAERLRFWSALEVEINLAIKAGSSVFRLGIDWGRIVLHEPRNGIESVVTYTLKTISLTNFHPHQRND